MWAKAKAYLRWLILQHPLGAIYMIKATDSFTRSERILVQANTMVMMLFFAVWLAYSRALNCCLDLRASLHCPNHLSVDVPCLGFDHCLALKEEGRVLIPMELHPLPTCDHFPQRTYTGTFYSVLLMSAILFPINMVLQQLFIWSAAAEVPAYWGYKVPPGGFARSKATTLFSNAGFLMYSFFINFKKIRSAATKLMAKMLNSAIHFLALVKFIEQAVFYSDPTPCMNACDWLH
ncbi:hypothetical protein CYMTET_6067 [Cymbomonas tetramitiformis]|uniref:Uncharacterized protein n=1 Tax=Cymbomonas tetramitiformis TaxID=36881 RepID=A0AAE0GYA8_9CHLO|nr:hypothetical protein CYMTET_6067 [Cymbomonas tetramitiformis]